MKYFIDTEYDWHPATGSIMPISIALVSEDGRSYYAINDYVLTQAFREDCTPFVRDHVLPLINATAKDPRCYPAKSIEWIRDDLKRFIGDHTPEFWGDYAAFDYVVLSMIMGEFSNWPEGWPMHINDLQQDAIPSITSAVPHNALADARAVRDAYVWAFAEHPPINSATEAEPAN